MRIASLHVYPVKSLRGVSVEAAEIERAGLRGDRRWMVVDASGAVLTARRHARMLAVTARPAGGVDGAVAAGAGDPEAIVLTTDGFDDLVVPPPRDGARVPVDLSRLDVALAAGSHADAWLSAALGRAVRLVWLDDPSRRSVSAAHGGRPGDPLSLADTGPVLLTSAPSLRRLDEWIVAGPEASGPLASGPFASGPLAMERFRPNVVVDGDVDMAAFAEDAWGTVRLGSTTLRFGEHCDRCVLTTIDPGTRVAGPEPIRTLARHRRWAGKVWFGVRLVPVAGGRVVVGDDVVATP